MSATEILQIFALADTNYEMSSPGKIIANVFYEPSTRTRLSFELAAKRIGADVITFEPETSSEKKGEGTQDTALTLQALGANVIVVRHPQWSIPKIISGFVNRCNVINAGDGSNEHPTQALLDLYTMKQQLGRIAGLHVGIVGDVHHSRVAHSLYPALAKMGAKTTLIGPKHLVSSRPGPYVSYDLDAKLPELDVCYVLRAQKERYHVSDEALRAGMRVTENFNHLSRYKLTNERAEKLPPHAIVMHPGPMNRGVEIDSSVADSPRAWPIQAQVTNGIKVRSALLHWLLT